MELRHLQQIAAIFRSGSFSAAARSLGVSQPTLSKSIARLEEELSVKLFEREGGAARPTESAILIADRAESILNSVSAVEHDVELLARGDTGLLRIGVSTLTRLKPLPHVVRQIAEQFPRLQVQIYTQSADSLLRGLRAGRYDLVFCSAEAAGEEHDLVRVKLFEERRTLIARHDHPLAREASLSPETILKYPMARFGRLNNFKRWAGAVSIEAQRNMDAFLSSEHSAIKCLLLEKDYFAYSVLFPFEAEVRAGVLVELPITNLPRFECWMLSTETRWRLPMVKAIAEIAKFGTRSQPHQGAANSITLPVAVT